MLQDVLTIFFFNDTATTEIYTLSLHDALPILYPSLIISFNIDPKTWMPPGNGDIKAPFGTYNSRIDRKSTRLNSSHLVISYAVFCLKKKKRPITSGTESRCDPRRAQKVGAH